MTDTQKIHQFAERNMLVEKYLLDELKGADLEDFEAHLFECSICFDQVKAGRTFTQNISGEPRKGLWRRIREFWAAHVGCMTFLQLGPLPSPPPSPELYRRELGFWAEAFISLFILLLLVSFVFFLLLRYSERFREFWARHVCAFMEEHGIRSDETKGGA